MELVKCTSCSNMLPKTVFDVFVSSELEKVGTFCIGCILDKTRQLVGSDFMFTNTVALEKLVEYENYCKNKGLVPC